MTYGYKSALPRLRSLALALHAAWGLSAFALPQGATVVNGQVQIAQPNAGAMQIKASNGAIINWRQFSIGSGESAQFVQPGSTSAVLNRVVGRDLSELMGQLKSNGQVFLINPNGIVIGGAARIDTNSFVASTLDISDADFLAGKLRFLAQPGAGAIRNEGLITAGPNGRIALIAPDIENSGIIHAPDGNILLAAGRKLEIASMDLDGIRFEVQAPTDSVLNLGQLLADNGAVRVFAGSIRHSGEVRANRMAVDADGSIVLTARNSVTLTAESATRADGASGGTIVVLASEGTARVQGVVSASGSAGSGGDVRILGERVALESGARISASGSTGGGQILVGGDFQGGNVSVQNAKRVFVGEGAKLEADARDRGDGGRIIVWADENTRFGGMLSARGGAQGGDGGFAEVSGKANLAFTGHADLGAAHGASGSLLLDPLDILVSLTSGILPIVVDEFADFARNVVTISPLTLAAVGGNVVLQAERDIYVRDAIALTAAGAGVSMTAGGAMFDNGSIFNTAGISTNGGAVILRANSISGPGTITTAGGAVDLMTSNALNYGSAISSGGGNVTLASQDSGVFSANVNAGSGTIQVTGTSISGGSFMTTGTAGFNASAGNVSVNSLSATVVNLTASNSINATLAAAERVNATSTGAGVTLTAGAGGPLRLGTINAASNAILNSSGGMEQAAGGLVTASLVRLNSNDGASGAGSLASPIRVASPSGLVQPTLELLNTTAPTHVALVGGPTLGRLQLQGTVAGLGGSTITGAANLNTLTLSDGGGVLNLSADASGGLANGFVVQATNGSLNVGSLSLPGVAVDLSSSAAVSVGTLTGGSLSVSSPGALTIGSATTTAGFGIVASTGACNTSIVGACATSAPIAAGTLSAGGTGQIRLTNRDNGDINVTSLTAGGIVNISAGNIFRTSFSSFNPTTQRTANNVVLGTVVAGQSVTVANQGEGNTSVASLDASGSVSVQAGGTFLPTLSTPSRTTGSVSIGNTEPLGASGNFSINQQGTGSLTLTGAVDRSNSGQINLTAANGSITALDALTARFGIAVSAPAGTLSLGQLSTGGGSSNGNITLQSSGDLTFASLLASAPSANSGNITISSGSGSVQTTADTIGNDVVGSGNVGISAGQAIGNGNFTNPLDIQSGVNNAVTLTAGFNIGALAKPVNVNTTGTIEVASTGGQYHVAATDGMASRPVKTIRLSASAAGIGNANSATFTSADLDVTATGTGTSVDIGTIAQAGGLLNEFKFSATGGSGLTFGDINLATAGGINKLVLQSTGDMTQMTGNVQAGNLNLDASSGNVTLFNVTSSSAVIASAGANNILRIRGADIATGNLAAQSIDVSGSGNVTVGSVASSGTQRGYPFVSYDYSAGRYPLDELQLSAGGMLSTSGNVSSPTSVRLDAGNGVSVNAGGGNVTAGAGNNSYYVDTVDIDSGAGTLAAAVIGAHDVSLRGQVLNTGAVTANRYLTVGNTATTSVATGNLTGGSGLALNSGTFSTGNLSAGSGSLTITANATGPQTYAPSSAIALSGGNVTITADNGIDLVGAAATLNAPSVALHTVAGNIAANLTGTTSLTITTAGTFNVNDSSALSYLDVTADGVAAGAGAGSAVIANGAAQSMSVATTFPMSVATLALDLKSPSFLDSYYRETSPVIAEVVLNTIGSYDSGLIYLTAPLATITTPSVQTAGASLAMYTSGDINLTSASLGGGNAYLYSYGGTINLTSLATGGGGATAYTGGDSTHDIHVRSIVTTGGNVSLTAENGSILRAGAVPLQIDTHNGQGLAAGTLTMSAANGSIGSGGTPIATDGVRTLNVSAQDEIAVSVGTTQLTNLSITTGATGNGAIAITGDTNFGGPSIVRAGGTALQLGAVTPTTTGDFALTATNGDIVVQGDIANINNLSLNAGQGYNSAGNLVIQAAGGPRSISANTYSLAAGQDVLIMAGAAAGENVLVTQTGTVGYNYVQAGRDIVIGAGGGTATVAHTAPVYTQYVDAGRDLRVEGGSAGVANATATLSAVGSQELNSGAIFGGVLQVKAGSADGASALVSATQSQSSSSLRSVSVLGGGDNASAGIVGGSQSFPTIYGDVWVVGGTGSGSAALIESTTGSQTLGSYDFATATSVLVQGGSGANAAASIRSAGSQGVFSDGDIRVLGGAVAGANAEILSLSGSQDIGSNYTYYSSAVTQDIVVQAGAGGTAAIKANGYQSLENGGVVSVLGGTGMNTSASIETTGGQSIGNSDIYYYRLDPTGNILVQGGTGDMASASIKAGSSQVIGTGGTVSVLGGSGAGAAAEIWSTGGSQDIGSTSTSSNDATDSIVVQAGVGGIARIVAQDDQSIMTGGDLSVIGGASAGMTASIVSTSGFQSIGNASSSFGNDPSGSILVLAGAGDGSAAFIHAATGQVIDAGGTIGVNGSGVNAYAEIVTTAGNQSVGNVFGGRDQTDAISLTGGTAAGSHARMSAGGSQSLYTSANLSLAGGIGDGSGAALLSGTGQNLTVRGLLSMVGGSGSAPGANETAIRNNTSGTQNINVTGNLSVTGGEFGSDTWVKQNGSGNQSITVGGNLALLAPASTPSTGVTSIESQGFGQTLFLGGALSIDNQAGWLTYIASSGTQLISADSIAIRLSSAAPVTGAFAGISATGNQTINLQGDGTTIGTATLSLVNTSSLSGSLAAVKTAADQVILMDYDSAGLVRIGSTAGLGATEISAQGTHTMVAGQLLIQGGDSVAATAGIYVPNGAAVISTLYGPIEILGGAHGAAVIDPPQLDMVSNNGVFLLAGPGAGADATITAGTFNLAATIGDLSLVNSTAAVAAINADVFNYFGHGNVNLTGGTITVTQAGTITIDGVCYGCDTNLIGPFTVSAFIPPPLDFGALVTADVLSLVDLAGGGIFDVFFDEDGNLVLSNRRLNQCY